MSYRNDMRGSGEWLEDDKRGECLLHLFMSIYVCGT